LKRLIVFLVTTVILAVGAAPASAATPAAQIKTLQKQVKTLQTQVKVLANALEANYAYDQCYTAVTADSFQHTWIFTNKLSNFPTFPVTSMQPPVDDKKACASLRNPTVTRVTPNADTPPTVAIFQTLINWLNG
jgi:ABC-type proline/glycine betaine transport system substrate-binding protein